MQHFLDRRQPSARLRPQLREIPVQRRRETAGNGENNRQWTSRDDRSVPVASRATAARDLPPRAFGRRRTGDPLRGRRDLPAAARAAKLPQAVGEPEETREVFVDQAVVEVPAGQAAELPEAVGEPEETREVFVDQAVVEVPAGQAAELPEAVGEPEETREVFVDRAVVEVPADQVRDVQPADGRLAEDGQLPAGGLAAGDLVSGDLP